MVPTLVRPAFLVPRTMSRSADEMHEGAQSLAQPLIAPGSHLQTLAQSEKARTSLGSVQKSGREWRHFLAGGCGGMVGAMITCPLEVVKTHLQSKHVARRSISDVVMHISRSDGVFGFWRGIGPMLVGVVPARAVNLGAYNAVKAQLLSAGYAEGPFVHMAERARGAGAGCGEGGGGSRGCVWRGGGHALVGGRVAYRGAFDALRSILREEGVRGLYTGLTPSIWGVSETAIQFVIYERLKIILAARQSPPCTPIRTSTAAAAASSSPSSSTLHSTNTSKAVQFQQPELRSYEYIAAAASAKLVAASLTYPHEVIRTRLRERGASAIYASALHCVRRVWAEEGVRGLYGGLGTHLLRVVPNTAILFFTYEKVSRFFVSEGQDL